MLEGSQFLGWSYLYENDAWRKATEIVEVQLNGYLS